MNRSILLSGIAGVMLAAGVAVAQPAPPAAPLAPRAPMAMKVQTRADVVARIQQHFAKVDTNRDGFITRAEADAVRGQRMAKMRGMADRRGMNGQRPAMDRGAAFDRLDTNRNGSISRDEFMAAPARQERRVVIVRNGQGGDMGGMQGMRGMRMHRMGGGMGMGLRGAMFEMADANRDGRVSLQEATDAAVRHFDMADANHDGRLAPEERMQVRQRMMQQVQRPPQG